MTRPEVEYVQEFYPPTGGKDSRGEFCVEIRSSDRHSLLGCFDLTLWTKNQGNTLNVPIRSIEKARRVARYWYETLMPEYMAALEAQRIIYAEFSETRKAEYEARKLVEAEELEMLLAQITPDTVRTTMWVCPDCEHGSEDLEDFEVPSYECQNDGPSGVGEEGRRCSVCSKFTGKATDHSCPSCEVPLDEAPETVIGVTIDGRFIPETDLPVEKRAA